MGVTGQKHKVEFRPGQRADSSLKCCGATGATGATGAATELEPGTLGRLKETWTDGVVNSAVGEVPRVRTELDLSDKLGAWRVRWGLRRMTYKVNPGLYAVGNPGAGSPVMVSANYKLSFDLLRRALGGLDAWIMVIDTRGINVWCAAGKGTFGTAGVVRSVAATGLESIVTHRELIVPQLGAPGVSAHDVKAESGFRVVYGPVRVEDIKGFLAGGLRATPGMRRVEFPMNERLALSPMELVPGLKLAVPVSAALFVLSLFASQGLLAAAGNAAIFIYGFLGAVVLGPALLPWLPGRAFSFKGFWLGVCLASALAIYASAMRPWLMGGWLTSAGWALIIPALASYLVMNFTGASTYTHLSGVRSEMRVAVPLQIAGAVLGAALWIGGIFTA